MADDDFYKPNAPQPPPRAPRPGEPLWAFVRESDKKRFHGESYGWEAQIFEGGELFTAHSQFVTRALAVRSADEMRKFFEVGGELQAKP